jgi:hypothetical protein
MEVKQLKKLLMNKKTQLILRIKSLINKCREKGKWEWAIKLAKKLRKI